eukprot:SAG31_NODE_2110_length_6426_cov_6.371898_7_plen_128_part_00
MRTWEIQREKSDKNRESPIKIEKVNSSYRVVLPGSKKAKQRRADVLLAMGYRHREEGLPTKPPFGEHSKARKPPDLFVAPALRRHVRGSAIGAAWHALLAADFLQCPPPFAGTRPPNQSQLIPISPN